MNDKEYVESKIGRRPSTLTRAELRTKVAMAKRYLAKVTEECQAVSEYDAEARGWLGCRRDHKG